MTRDDIIARAETLLARKPHLKYSHAGPNHAQWPIHAKTRGLDCMQLVCLCVGIEKDDGPGGDPWWSANATVHDAKGAQTRWRIVPFAPGVAVVYAEAGMGHAGIVVGGTEKQPETIESAAGKKGLWRGQRRAGFWRRKGAIFVLPVGVSDG